MNTGSRLPFISTRRAGVTIGHIFPSPSLLRAGVTIGQTRHPPRSFWLVLTSTQQQQVCIDVNRALQKTDRQKENHGRVLCCVVLCCEQVTVFSVEARVEELSPPQSDRDDKLGLSVMEA